MTDSDKITDPGADAIDLSEAGVDVRIDNCPCHLHHKFAVVDGKTLITGSFNWTRSAAEENYENLLVTDDPLLVEAYREEFERLSGEETALFSDP